MNLNVKSVIFDMDGVITNTMPDHYRSWKKILQDEGLHVTYEDIYKREGQPGINSVFELSQEYNLEMNDTKAAQILEKKESFFKKIVKTRFITGARNFLKHLHRRDLQLALVTGTSRHELMEILPEQIRSLFKVIITGNDVKNGKPHPEPYLKSLNKLSIRPQEAVVIENAPFGIRSAKEAGITCLALETSLPKKYLNEADAVFPTIKSLQANVSFIS